MLIKIVVGLVVLLAVLAVIIASRPSHFRVTRTAHLKAAPAAVFPHLNDLHLWNAWSPWAKMDPTAKYTFQGPSSGEGASMAWVGGNEVGAGSMTIKESEPLRRVAFQLEFLRPFQASNQAEFTIQPEGEGTTVSWTMTGRYNFMFKAVGLFMDCGKMCGDQFDQGLASLKEIVDTPAAKSELLTMQPQL